jgi:hypothetical protein
MYGNSNPVFEKYLWIISSVSDRGGNEKILT